MFEIYREAGYGRQFRVVYFTELDEHNKEAEINRAMAGEHFLDGFLQNICLDRAKSKINDIVARLNRGEPLDAAVVEQELASSELLG